MTISHADAGYDCFRSVYVSTAFSLEIDLLYGCFYFGISLQDLSNYKYDIMVMKSLDILNKLYSSQSDMFKLALDAQVS